MYYVKWSFFFTGKSSNDDAEQGEAFILISSWGTLCSASSSFHCFSLKSMRQIQQSLRISHQLHCALHNFIQKQIQQPRSVPSCCSFVSRRGAEQLTQSLCDTEARHGSHSGDFLSLLRAWSACRGKRLELSAFSPSTTGLFVSSSTDKSNVFLC